MRSYGPKFPNGMDVSHMACLDKLELFQSAIQAIDLPTLDIHLLRLCMKHLQIHLDLLGGSTKTILQITKNL